MFPVVEPIPGWDIWLNVAGGVGRACALEHIDQARGAWARTTAALRRPESAIVTDPAPGTGNGGPGRGAWVEVVSTVVLGRGRATVVCRLAERLA